MTFAEYQAAAARTALYPGRGQNIYYPALGMGGEVGEILNKIKKIMRDDAGLITAARKEDLKAELGDVLWYVSAVADELQVSLDEVAAANVAKLAGRLERGTLHGAGDVR